MKPFVVTYRAENNRARRKRFASLDEARTEAASLAAETKSFVEVSWPGKTAWGRNTELVYPEPEFIPVTIDPDALAAAIARAKSA